MKRFINIRVSEFLSHLEEGPKIYEIKLVKSEFFKNITPPLLLSDDGVNRTKNLFKRHSMAF